jgi:hypothetical protein
MGPAHELKSQVEWLIRKLKHNEQCSSRILAALPWFFFNGSSAETHSTRGTEVQLSFILEFSIS